MGTWRKNDVILILIWRHINVDLTSFWHQMLPGKSFLNIFYSDSLSAFIFVEPLAVKWDVSAATILLRCMCVCACICPSKFFLAITPTFMNRFQNYLTQLLSVWRRSAFALLSTAYKFRFWWTFQNEIICFDRWLISNSYCILLI